MKWKYLLLSIFLLVLPISVYSADTDLSTNKTTIWSSGCLTGCNGKGNNFDYRNLNDGVFGTGNTDTYTWIPITATKANWTIDLGQLYRVTRLALFEPGYGHIFDREPTAIDIWYSDDNTTWVNVYSSITMQDGGLTNWTAESGTNYTVFNARYVILRNVAGEANEARIAEFSIWGTNVTNAVTNIQMINSYDNSTINVFQVAMYNSSHTFYANATSGTATFYNYTGSFTFNVTSSNYNNKNFTATLADITNIVQYMTPIYHIFNVSYLNFVNNGTNYTRNLNYSFNYICPTNNNLTFNLNINSTPKVYFNGTCNGANQTIYSNYTTESEGTYKISFYANSTFLPSINNVYFGNKTFVSDLYNPIINSLFFINLNNFEQARMNVSLNCTDTIMPFVTYNLTVNNNLLRYANYSINSIVSNLTTILYGSNNLVGACSDLFGTTIEDQDETIYSSQIILIDEKNNTLFDVRNISGARVYFDDNSTFYDFYLNNASSINFTSANNTKLRVELNYPDGAIITRYIDISLLSSEIRVCANRVGITHYEQLILSSSERPVVMKNVFANCLIAGDYTRFAYQDALSLKAYTIASLYYLYTITDGTQSLLASIDGSTQTFINLENLEFALTGYNISILGDFFTYQETNYTKEFKVYYQNYLNDNTALHLQITREDTFEIILNTSSFTNPNNFTLLLNYGTLSNITNMTLFKATLTKTKDDGSIDTDILYLKAGYGKGSIKQNYAIMVSVLLTIFGLTFASTAITFSWFGIFIMIGAIGTLSYAGVTQYTLFIGALEIVILLYLIIVLYSKNYQTVS